VARRRPRGLLIVVAVALVVALGLAVVVLLVVRGREAGRASVDEALERFRSGQDTVPDGDGAGPARPPEGVYTLTGSGTEQLSFQLGGQAMGPEMPATVTWQGDDCWELRVEFNANHTQSWVYCVDGARMVDRGGSITQRFDLVVAQVDSRSTSVCDPPAPTTERDATPGAVWAQRCTIETEGQGRTSMTGPLTFVGTEEVDVGGTAVLASHTVSERNYEGAQRGRGRIENWYEVDTGFPVRSRWTLSITSGSPIGDVTYTESGEWSLSSLTPRT
jgi:hypothetical protein